MKHIDLFSGIGGFALAASWVWPDHDIVTFCEKDKCCQKILKKHWPDTPICEDIYELKGQQCDLITGGFPCQPFSTAGKQRGTDDDRYLWPEMLRIIREAQPTWVVGENVAGIIGMALDQVLIDLEMEGYACQCFIIPACGVDAPHRRNRVWIVGHASSTASQRDTRGLFTSQEGVCGEGQQDGDLCVGSEHASQDVADTDKHRTQRSEPEQARDGAGVDGCGQENPVANSKCDSGRAKVNGCETNRQNTARPPGGAGRPSGWLPEPNVGRRFNGFPSWLYRHCGKGMSYESSKRASEALRSLWNDDVAKTIWRTIGGFDRVQKAEILLSVMCEHQGNIDQARILLASQEALEAKVRSMWDKQEITGSSCGPGHNKQQAGEHPDPMQDLSRLLAFSGPENWQVSSWEDGIARVATNIPKRVDRLRALGNAIVPQVAEQIFRAIASSDTERK